jgi:hypothetical protein
MTRLATARSTYSGPPKPTTPRLPVIHSARRAAPTA